MNESNMMSIDLISATERNYKETTAWGNEKYLKYGDKDDLPEYLQECYENSPIHSGIINSVADMIVGDGLFTEAGNEPSPRIQEWLKKSQFGMDGEDTLNLIALDIKKNGISFIEVIRGTGTIATLFRSDVEKWRLGAIDENRVMKEVWYSEDFQDPYTHRPVAVPVWTEGTKEKRSILVIRRPISGGGQYPKPDYGMGGAKFAELDKEIGTFHLNSVLNQMAPSMAIELNNGVPETKEKRAAIKKEIQKKLTGTGNAGRILIGFNEGKEHAAEYHTFALSEAHLMYDQLARTVTHQVTVSHRVISPLLHGVRDVGAGFSSNAEEMALATRLFERSVIKPFRSIIEKALKPVFREMGQVEELFFTSPELETLTDQPQEEEDTEAVDEQLSKNFTEDEGTEMLLSLSNHIQVVPDTWELIDEHEVEGDGEFKLSTAKRLEGFLLNLFSNEGGVSSKPNEDSSQDSGVYKVRYAYETPPKSSSKGESRDFCKAMMSITNRGGVFRREDVIQMSFKGVNKSHGHKGRNYNLFLYKGGVNCSHVWMRRIYKEKVSKGNRVGVNEARREGFKPPVNDKKVATPPKFMPDNGHHPNYKG